MLVYERHFLTPVIGGTGHAQCNIWSCSHGWFSVVLEVGKNRLVTFGQCSIREATHIRMSFAIYQIELASFGRG